MKISRSEIKGAIAIGVLCLVAFAFVYFIWPYTDAGKAVDAEKRQNAIAYLNATALTDDPECILQRTRLIEKYDLQDSYGETYSDPLRRLLKDDE